MPSVSERLLCGWSCAGREQEWQARSLPSWILSSCGLLRRECSPCHRAFSLQPFQPGLRQTKEKARLQPAEQASSFPIRITGTPFPDISSRQGRDACYLISRCSPDHLRNRTLFPFEHLGWKVTGQQETETGGHPGQPGEGRGGSVGRALSRQQGKVSEAFTVRPSRGHATHRHAHGCLERGQRLTAPWVRRSGMAPLGSLLRVSQRCQLSLASSQRLGVLSQAHVTEGSVHFPAAQSHSCLRLQDQQENLCGLQSRTTKPSGSPDLVRPTQKNFLFA